MSENVLTVVGITAGYNGTAVLRDFELTVAPGEVVALLGANGAGKTTALRVISGVLRPDTGTVQFGDLDVLRVRPHVLAQQGMAHVPDTRGIFAPLTAEEHFRLRGSASDFEQALSYFPEMEPLRGRRAGLLSGGEQQMLAIAASLARRPRLLLIDEMSLGLAPVAVQRLLPVIRDYATRTGAGVVLVEQHVQLALEICDRGCVLSHGETVMAGDRSQLLADQHLLVASYLGETQTGTGDLLDVLAKGSTP